MVSHDDEEDLTDFTTEDELRRERIFEAAVYLSISCNRWQVRRPHPGCSQLDYLVELCAEYAESKRVGGQ